MPPADRKLWRDPKSEFGVGFLADGTLDVVTPEEYAKRVIERDAEESLDAGFPEEDLDDLSDLDDEPE